MEEREDEGRRAGEGEGAWLQLAARGGGVTWVCRTRSERRRRESTRRASGRRLLRRRGKRSELSHLALEEGEALGDFGHQLVVVHRLRLPMRSGGGRRGGVGAGRGGLGNSLRAAGGGDGGGRERVGRAGARRREGGRERERGGGGGWTEVGREELARQTESSPRESALERETARCSQAVWIAEWRACTCGRRRIVLPEWRRPPDVCACSRGGSRTGPCGAARAIA